MGEIGILNVAAGDTKLIFDPKDPAESARASRILKDMIRRGFAILIEVGKDEKGPLYRRAYDFDESTSEYIIAGDPTEQAEAEIEESPIVEKPSSPPPPRRQSRKAAKTVRVPAAEARGVAVARTAGG